MISRLPRAVTGAAVAVVALYVLETAVPFLGPGVHDAVRDWGKETLYLAAAAGCAARAISSRRDRAAWILLSLGIAAFAAGSLVWMFGPMMRPPLFSSIAWLAFYPFAYAATVLLLRALGAATCTLFVPTLIDGVHSKTGIFFLASRPVGDAMLLGTVAWALTLMGRRAGRMWIALGAAFAVFAVSDLVLDIAISRGEELDGALNLVGACFPLAYLLIAYAGSFPPGPPRSVRMDSRTILVVPTACVVVALGLLVADRFTHVPPSAYTIAIAAVVAGFVRAIFTVHALGRLHESRRFQQGFEEATRRCAGCSAAPSRS
jgi:hypothetical protein